MALNPNPQPIVCDLSTLTALDLASLHALARLQLVARRLGTSIELANASAEVLDLLSAFGLADVLPVVPGSGVDEVGREIEVVDVDRQAEDGEQLRVDEVVDRGDAAR